MDATFGLPVLIGLIAVAILFDFLNGLHDAANSIATVVSTRVLRPLQAVALGGLLQLHRFPVLRPARGANDRHRDRRRDIVEPRVIFGALMGAISWNVITWRLGIPSSSSHALIGGLVGAGVAKAGVGVIVWGGLAKTGAAIVLSPLIGFLLALLLVLVVSWTFVRSTPLAVDNTFRTLQLVSAALYSLGHGGNDAQKTMGVIAVLLYSQGLLGPDFYVPFWVVIVCQAAMGLGTLFGGWRIVRTMGSRITHLTPVQGFCAETGGAITLFAATGLGVPVSTTHTITGAIVGVGAARRVSAVRWNVASSIVVAWLVTLPASASDRRGFLWPSPVVLMHLALCARALDLFRCHRPSRYAVSLSARTVTGPMLRRTSPPTLGSLRCLPRSAWFPARNRCSRQSQRREWLRPKGSTRRQEQ